MNNTITLESSFTSVIVEFFETSLNCILVERGIYSKLECDLITKYGLSLPIISEPEASEYIQNLTKQLKEWLDNGLVQQLVIAIKSKETLETLERWQFNVKLNSENANEDAKSKQINSILRQIISSVSFLPELDPKDCTYNVLVYVDKDVTTSQTWCDARDESIKESEQIPLSSFQAESHKVDVAVTYNTTL